MGDACMKIARTNVTGETQIFILSRCTRHSDLRGLVSANGTRKKAACCSRPRRDKAVRKSGYIAVRLKISLVQTRTYRTYTHPRAWERQRHTGCVWGEATTAACGSTRHGKNEGGVACSRGSVACGAAEGTLDRHVARDYAAAAMRLDSAMCGFMPRQSTTTQACMPPANRELIMWGGGRGACNCAANRFVCASMHVMRVRVSIWLGSFCQSIVCICARPEITRHDWARAHLHG
jgi:hypothetical protein